jgi:hypothetical protein
MHFSGRMIVAGLLALAVVILAQQSGRTAESPLAGRWKLSEVGAKDTALVLLKLSDKDGQLQAEAVSSPLLKDTMKVRSIKLDKGVIHLALKFAGGPLEVTLYPPKGEKEPKLYRGTIKFGPQIILAQLERTDETALDKDNPQTTSEAGKLLLKASGLQDAKEQEEAFKAIIEKHGDTAAGFQAALSLVLLKARTAEKVDDVRAAAEQATKLAAAFGPDAETNAIFTLAQRLGNSDTTAPLAAEYAKKADQTFAKDDISNRRLGLLKAWAAALRKAGKDDEAKEMDARVAKLEKDQEDDLIKHPIPFKFEPYKGRKAPSKRVAVVELFTGAQCPPCVSADIAFDAGLQAYKPADVVFLEYHLHIPGPDPMTNADSVARAKYYGNEVEGTPTAFINGKVTSPLGGVRDTSAYTYETLSEEINAALETETPVTLTAKATRKGEKFEVEAEYAGVKKTGENTRLRFVVVEDVVHFVGRNKQREHHHVVRGFIGKPEGFEVKKARDSQAVMMNVTDLKKTLGDYLEGYTDTFSMTKPFQGKENPLELKNLKVIALIQDDDTKEILQAAQVDVPDAK